MRTGFGTCHIDGDSTLSGGDTEMTRLEEICAKWTRWRESCSFAAKGKEAGAS